MMFSLDPQAETLFETMFSTSFLGPDGGATMSTSSEPGMEDTGPAGPMERWRCGVMIGDFTLPAQQPENPGEIPTAISLPLFEDVNLTATLDYWTWNWDHSISWIGRTTETSRGTVVITVVEGKYSAVIRQGGRSYLIQPSKACNGHRIVDIGESPSSSAPEEGPQADPAPPAMGPIAQTIQLPGATQQLPSIDIMMVYSGFTRVRLGGDPSDPADTAGVRGWAANAVHELDLIFIRSRTRTHVPRLVGVKSSVELIDPGPEWEPLDCPAVCPIESGLNTVKYSPSIEQERIDHAADLVVGLLSQPYEVYGASNPSLASVACSTIEGTAVSSSDTVAVDRFTVQHELSHTFGIKHNRNTSNPSPRNPLVVPATPEHGLNVGYTPFASGWATAELLRPADTTNTYQYMTLMGSLDDERLGPGTNVPTVNRPVVAGCRVPVFGRATQNFGWRLEPGIAPCDQYEDFDNFGSNLFDPFFLPDVGGNGVRVGPWLDAATVITPTRSENPNNRRAIEPEEVFRFGDDGDYLLRAYDNTFRTPLQIVEVYRPDVGCEPGPGAPVFPEAVRPHLIGQDIERPTDVNATFEWDRTPYADLTLSPGGPTDPPNPYDPNHPETSPFYLELGTSFGGDDTVATYVSPGACAPSGACTYAVTLPDLSTPRFGRLWTQHDANRWSYVEFRMSIGGTTISCMSENPEWAPQDYASFTCGATVTAQAAIPEFGGLPGVRVELDDAIPGAPTFSAAVYWDLDADNPYDMVAFGQAASGTPFCCMWAADQATQTSVVLVHGSTQTDTVRMSTYGGRLHGDLQTGQTLVAAVLGVEGRDELSGSPDPTMPVFLDGGDHNDRLHALNLVTGMLGRGGLDKLIVEGDPAGDSLVAGAPTVVDGGSADDTLVLLVAGDLVRDLSLRGGTAKDAICSVTHDVEVRANNGTAGPQQESLYLAEAAVQLPTSGTWSTDSTNINSHCGNDRWGQPPNPTAPFGSCVYDLDAAPARCLPWMAR